jgi:hypothetical protein
VVVVLAVVVGDEELVDEEEQATSASDATARAATMTVSRWRVGMINTTQGGVGRCW